MIEASRHSSADLGVKQHSEQTKKQIRYDFLSLLHVHVISMPNKFIYILRFFECLLLETETVILSVQYIYCRESRGTHVYTNR